VRELEAILLAQIRAGAFETAVSEAIQFLKTLGHPLGSFDEDGEGYAVWIAEYPGERRMILTFRGPSDGEESTLPSVTVEFGPQAFKSASDPDASRGERSSVPRAVVSGVRSRAVLLDDLLLRRRPGAGRRADGD
jgi:hypothetical protein